MKLVIGISGASGAIYAKRLLDFLKTTPHEVSLTASENALEIGREEVGIDYREYGFRFYSSRDFTAPFASGSAHYDQLAVVPCSMGMLGRIAHGYSDDLLSRTADVFFKERRRVILVPRETPLSLIHIENMRLVTLAGAIVLPAIPSFYLLKKNQPQSGVEGEGHSLGLARPDPRLESGAIPLSPETPSKGIGSGFARPIPPPGGSGEDRRSPPLEAATRAPTIEEAVDTVIARILDHMEIENQLRQRWGSCKAS